MGAGSAQSPPVANHKRSLNGNRFGILVNGRVVFDNVSVPEKQRAIFVYDRANRAQAFHVIAGPIAEQIDFDLSPDGSMLAVLVDGTVRLYKLPE
jgi:hypothetical protein